jgi:hypothetical protein
MIALGVVLRGGEGPIVAGTVWFFIALILVGTMLPISGIVNERKKQNLAFLMSLPVSSIQYTTAKLISTGRHVSGAMGDAVDCRGGAD